MRSYCTRSSQSFCSRAARSRFRALPRPAMLRLLLLALACVAAAATSNDACENGSDLNFELGEYDAFRLHSVGMVYAYILDLYSCRSGGGVSDATFLYHDEGERPQWSGTPVVPYYLTRAWRSVKFTVERRNDELRLWPTLNASAVTVQRVLEQRNFAFGFIPLENKKIIPEFQPVVYSGPGSLLSKGTRTTVDVTVSGGQTLIQFIMCDFKGCRKIELWGAGADGRLSYKAFKDLDLTGNGGSVLKENVHTTSYANRAMRLTALYEDSAQGDRLYLWVDDKFDQGVDLPLLPGMNRITVQEHPSNSPNYSPGTAYFKFISAEAQTERMFNYKYGIVVRLPADGRQAPALRVCNGGPRGCLVLSSNPTTQVHSLATGCSPFRTQDKSHCDHYEEIKVGQAEIAADTKFVEFAVTFIGAAIRVEQLGTLRSYRMSQYSAGGSITVQPVWKETQQMKLVSDYLETNYPIYKNNNELVTIIASYEEAFGGLVFELCRQNDLGDCHRLTVTGINGTRLDYEETVIKDGVHTVKTRAAGGSSLPTGTPDWLEFAVRFGNASAPRLSVWLLSPVYAEASVAVDEAQDLLLLRQKLWPKQMRSIKTVNLPVVDVLAKFNATLRGRDSNPEQLELLAAKALVLAKDAEEEQLARYMQLVARTRPLKLKDTAYGLAWHLEEFVSIAQQAAKRSQSLQVNAMVGDLVAKGKKFSAELDEKIAQTNDLLENHLKPSIQAAAAAVLEQQMMLEEKLKNATDTIKEDQEKINELKVAKAAFKFFEILGDVISAVGDKIGGGIVKGVSEFAGGKVNDEIESLKAEIMKYEDILERFKPLLPLLVSIQDVVADLEQVKDDSIGIRAWLSGDKMIKFRTNLLLIGPDNVGAVLTGQEVYRLFQDAATNIIGAMDKVESYEISKKQAELSQQQYLDINSGKFQKQLESLRITISHNVIVSDYRTTMRSLQLYAYPFCSLIEYASVEQCLQEGDYAVTSTAVNCVNNLYDVISEKLRRDRSYEFKRTQPVAFEYFPEAGDFDNSFVTWGNAEHRNLIRDVLAGKEVVVHADVLAHGHDDIFAVKFNKIALRFWSEDAAVRAEVEAALLPFKMSLVHMGTSYYECGDGVVAYAHPTLNVTSSFLKDAETHMPIALSEGYSALTGNDFFMSPYAMWRIRLLPLSYKKTVDFSSLAKFADQVNMSLVGVGSYVSTVEKCDNTCVWDFEPTKSKRPSPFTNFAATHSRPSITAPIKSNRIFRHPAKPASSASTPTVV